MRPSADIRQERWTVVVRRHGTYKEEDARPGMGLHKRTDGEAKSGKEARVKNRPDRKMTRKRIEARVDEPGPNQRRSKHVQSGDDCGREPTKPKPDRPRPIWARAKLA